MPLYDTRKGLDEARQFYLSRMTLVALARIASGAQNSAMTRQHLPGSWYQSAGKRANCTSHQCYRYNLFTD